MTKSAPLTDEQLAKAAELRALGWGWRKIARTVRGSEERLMRHFEPDKAMTGHSTRDLKLGLPAANSPRIVIPPSVLADRDRRLELIRDPVSVLMGDPPPGYSALDRRTA